MTGDEHALHLPDGGVAESARACAEFLLVLTRARELGLVAALGPAGRAMFDVVEQAGRSYAQRGGTDRGPVRPAGTDSGSPSFHDPIDTTDAAALLGVLPRQVRRLCRAGQFSTARELGSGWLLERAEVVARAADRGVTDADHGEDAGEHRRR